MVSADLSAMLAEDRNYAQLFKSVEVKQAIVLPAFETSETGQEGRADALLAVKGACEGAGVITTGSACHIVYPVLRRCDT